MTLHGFRLHTVQARRGRTREPLQFTGPGDATSQFYDDVLRLQGEVFARDATYKELGSPSTGAGAELPARTPVLRVDHVQRDGSAVEIEVSYGRIGDQQFLMSADGTPDEPLQRRAPGRQYRHVFFGANVGTESVLCSSVAGRTYTGDALLSRVSVENARRAMGTADSGDWVKWLPAILVDDRRVTEVVEAGNIDGLRLKRKAVTAAGTRVKMPLTLAQNGILQRDKPKVISMVRGWLTRKADGAKGVANPRDEIAALVELLDADGDDVTGIGFDDGVLSFSEGGKTQSVSPSNLQRILVYPTGDDELTFPQLRNVARNRLAPLLGPAQISIDL